MHRALSTAPCVWGGGGGALLLQGPKPNKDMAWVQQNGKGAGNGFSSGPQALCIHLLVITFGSYLCLKV